MGTLSWWQWARGICRWPLREGAFMLVRGGAGRPPMGGTGSFEHLHSKPMQILVLPLPSQGVRSNCSAASRGLGRSAGQVRGSRPEPGKGSSLVLNEAQSSGFYMNWVFNDRTEIILGTFYYPTPGTQLWGPPEVYSRVQGRFSLAERIYRGAWEGKKSCFMVFAYCSFSALALTSSLLLLLSSLCVGTWQVESAGFLVISGNHTEC